MVLAGREGQPASGTRTNKEFSFFFLSVETSLMLERQVDAHDGTPAVLSLEKVEREVGN